MSDTPRTDAEAVRLDDWGDNMFGPDFARQLERELNEAQECLREIVSQLTMIDARPSGETWHLASCDGDEVARWRKAAGIDHIADASKMVGDGQ